MVATNIQEQRRQRIATAYRDLWMIDRDELERCVHAATALGFRHGLGIEAVADIEAELVVLALRLRSRAV